MSREKSGDSVRGRPVDIPAWWLDALNRRVQVDDLSNEEIGKRLASAAKRPKPFSGQHVGDFLRGKVTSDVTMYAFLALYPDFPSPVFWAKSYEEAEQLRRITGMYGREQDGQRKSLKIEETVEDTSERQKAKSRRSK